MVRVTVIEKVTTERRPKVGQGVSPVDVQGKSTAGREKRL